jgi:hypothetical protein
VRCTERLALISLLVVLVVLPAGYFFAAWLTRPIVQYQRSSLQGSAGRFNGAGGDSPKR